MTHDESARTIEEPQEPQGGARRRRAREDGPPRFVDRFSPEEGGRAPVTATDPPASAATGQVSGAEDRSQAADGPVRIAVTPGPGGPTSDVRTTDSLHSVESPRDSAAQPQDSAALHVGASSRTVTAHAGDTATRQDTLPPTGTTAPSAHASGTGLRPREGRRSFLSPDEVVVPAETGFRGFLAGLGIRLRPSTTERAVRVDIATVSRHWPGPRTISVVNGKGGANKTPTTVLLAAVFARNGGGPVLAWDNNETRGTLGWRTEQGPHEATVLDFLPQTDALLAPSAQSALLARYVHHQTADKFDVLRSKPAVLASQQKVTAEDFDALHEVASKYFRLNVIDSGNDETAERWLRMIHHTDQLVIATTTLEEHAEAGALLLEALRDRGGRYGELARQAVVIISQSDKNGTRAQPQAIADGFGELARRTVTIPFDVALLKGRIRFSAMRPATQRAWLTAAAAVAEGL